ncbi:hypothetical protein DFJ73DRAFT_823314 [Zopfochytrium polystomum]|nr:hypothetical protein DFJ73DRAFT_823314 [Zopfochytrium polystomum]
MDHRGAPSTSSTSQQPLFPPKRRDSLRRGSPLPNVSDVQVARPPPPLTLRQDKSPLPRNPSLPTATLSITISSADASPFSSPAVLTLTQPRAVTQDNPSDEVTTTTMVFGGEGSDVMVGQSGLRDGSDLAQPDRRAARRVGDDDLGIDDDDDRDDWEPMPSEWTDSSTNVMTDEELAWQLYLQENELILAAQQAAIERLILDSQNLMFSEELQIERSAQVVHDSAHRRSHSDEVETRRTTEQSAASHEEFAVALTPDLARPEANQPIPRVRTHILSKSGKKISLNPRSASFAAPPFNDETALNATNVKPIGESAVPDSFWAAAQPRSSTPSAQKTPSFGLDNVLLGNGGPKPRQQNPSEPPRSFKVVNVKEGPPNPLISLSLAGPSSSSQTPPQPPASPSSPLYPPRNLAISGPGKSGIRLPSPVAVAAMATSINPASSSTSHYIDKSGSQGTKLSSNSSQPHQQHRLSAMQSPPSQPAFYSHYAAGPTGGKELVQPRSVLPHHPHVPPPPLSQTEATLLSAAVRSAVRNSLKSRSPTLTGAPTTFTATLTRPPSTTAQSHERGLTDHLDIADDDLIVEVVVSGPEGLTTQRYRRADLEAGATAPASSITDTGHRIPAVRQQSAHQPQESLTFGEMSTANPAIPAWLAPALARSSDTVSTWGSGSSSGDREWTGNWH